MNCELARQNIVFFVYDELPDDRRFETEQHLQRCGSCRQEWESVREFRASMSQVTPAEPSPNLLAHSRMRLQEALETAVQGPKWRRLILDPAEWLRQMKFSPALAAAILMVGFAGGIVTAFQSFRGQPLGAPAGPEPASASVAGIRGITQDPGSNRVRIKYDTVQPESAQGSLDDPKIQQLLLYAARNQQNSGVRVESIDLLSKNCADEKVRAAMLNALRYDKNPGVRLKALDGVQSYVKDDVRVRDAVIEALLNDPNSGVRTEAINLLQAVKADSSVRNAFRHLAQKDDNEFIRSQAEQTLESMPDID